jgi:LacI family transcriptional regulator
MAVTIEQIANRAGLSRQTVSNILNQKGHLFRMETRELVARVCEEMGYRPNYIARALRSGRFNAVGLVASTSQNAGRIAGGALMGIEEELREHDMHLVSGRFSEGELTSSEYVPKLLRELIVDGLIVNYTLNIPPKTRELLAANKVPSVWINAQLDRDCVRPDDFHGARVATEYLLSYGHRRIAFVNLLHTEALIRSNYLHFSVKHRLEGYEAAMKAAGLRPRLIARSEGVTEEASVMGPFAWLQQPDRPTAVIFHSPNSGVGSLLMQLGRLGLAMPQDLSVLCIADEPFDAYGVPMDHVVIPHYQVGRAVVRALIAKIENPRMTKPVEVIPCELRTLGCSVAPLSGSGAGTGRKKPSSKSAASKK